MLSPHSVNGLPVVAVVVQVASYRVDARKLPRAMRGDGTAGARLALGRSRGHRYLALSPSNKMRCHGRGEMFALCNVALQGEPELLLGFAFRFLTVLDNQEPHCCTIRGIGVSLSEQWLRALRELFRDRQRLSKLGIEL